MHSLKIGITGASGLVGSHIAKALCEDGHKVKGLHVSGFVPSMLSEQSIEWIKGDLRDFGVIDDFVEGLDLIIHTAAIVSFKKKDKDDMFNINVEGTRELVNALKGKKTRLIHFSSIAVLGRTENGLMTNEEVFWNENLPHSDYAYSKFLAEMEVMRGVSEGLDAMLFLPSVILGVTERSTGSSSIWNQIKKMPSLAPIGGNGFVDVIDLVTYVQKSIQDWKTGERIILSGSNTKFKKLYELTNTFRGKTIKVKALNPTILLLILPFILFLFKILGVKTEISKSAIMTTSKTFSYDTSRSINLYGDHYTKIEETVERCVKEQ